MTLFVETWENNSYCLTALETNPELDSYGDTYLVLDNIPATISVAELVKLVQDKFPTCQKLVFKVSI